jgi:hypothetical protein
VPFLVGSIGWIAGSLPGLVLIVVFPAFEWDFINGSAVDLAEVEGEGRGRPCGGPIVGRGTEAKNGIRAWQGTKGQFVGGHSREQKPGTKSPCLVGSALGLI